MYLTRDCLHDKRHVIWSFTEETHTDVVLAEMLTKEIENSFLHLDVFLLDDTNKSKLVYIVLNVNKIATGHNF